LSHHLGSGCVRFRRRLRRSRGDSHLRTPFGLHRALQKTGRRRTVSGNRPNALRVEDGQPSSVGLRHYRIAQEIRKTLSTYEELKDIIAMFGIEELFNEDRHVVHRARRLERFLTQPFFVTEGFTNQHGKLVSLEDSLDGCERILNDKFADYPERALYMIGPIQVAKTS
jgi:F0F1-type ATP synthase beta subunit